MKNLMFCIVFGGFYLFLIRCSPNQSGISTSNTVENIEASSILITTFVLSRDAFYGDSWLQIEEDTAAQSRSVLLKTYRGKDLISVVGGGDWEIIRNDRDEIAIDSVDFDLDGQQELVFSANIFGSTYGAFFYCVVYKANEWDISKLPFDRAYMVQQGGIRYIVDGSNYYRFKAGDLYIVEPPR